MGYFNVMAEGTEAQELSTFVRIGKRLDLEGRLWTRTYRNRQGMEIKETKVLFEQLRNETKKEQ